MKKLLSKLVIISSFVVVGCVYAASDVEKIIPAGADINAVIPGPVAYAFSQVSPEQQTKLLSGQLDLRNQIKNANIAVRNDNQALAVIMLDKQLDQNKLNAAIKQLMNDRAALLNLQATAVNLIYNAASADQQSEIKKHLGDSLNAGIGTRSI